MIDLGHLETAREVLRIRAIDAGRAIEAAKVNGAKMRQIWALEAEHRAAWGRFYSVDNRLHEAIAS